MFPITKPQNKSLNLNDSIYLIPTTDSMEKFSTYTTCIVKFFVIILTFILIITRSFNLLQLLRYPEIYPEIKFWFRIFVLECDQFFFQGIKRKSIIFIRRTITPAIPAKTALLNRISFYIIIQAIILHTCIVIAQIFQYNNQQIGEIPIFLLSRTFKYEL